MGESTCLMHSFSYASTIPTEANNQGNPVHSLGESISFGRFTSESLSWEKWSTFSHKRYVEEAERYTQPGSVAQKKAFFEAHYKRIAAKKAAALLEQANASININTHELELEERVCDNNSSTTNDSQTVLKFHDSPTTVFNSQLAVNEEQTMMRQDANKDDCVVNADGYNSAVNPVELEIDKVVGDDRVKVNEPRAENPMETEKLNNFANFEDQSMVSASEDSGTPQMEKPLLKPKLISDQDVSRPIIKKKPAFSSLRSSIYRKTSKAPSSSAKSVASVHPRKENAVTPRTKNSAMGSVEEWRATPKSLHTLMNYTPVREPNKLTSPAVRKMERARAAPSAFKASKQCATPLRTPTKTPANGVNKHPLTTACAENTRLETPLHPSAAGSKTTGPKWHILSAVSKSLTTYRNKLQSPTVTTPFILRTEERATRRKQKLEEKFNDKEVHKVQLQTKLKEKAETEFRRLRQSLCFKARPLPDFYRERETLKNQIKMTSQANPKSLTPGKKSPATISRSPSRSSTKNNSSKNAWKKNAQNPTHSLSSLAEMMAHENISPNIQH